MHSYYVYDEVLELYALMLIDQDGDEHPIVLEFEEFDQLARWTESGPWIRPTIGLEIAAIRTVLHEIIKRDPFD
jgi:hypothetical protein